jgi:hypothetical protein
MYIALFLFIRETSLPLVLVFPFVERTGKEKERKKSEFFFFFSRVRSCASCYLFLLRGFAREAVRRRPREALVDVVMPMWLFFPWNLCHEFFFTERFFLLKP